MNIKKLIILVTILCFSLIVGCSKNTPTSIKPATQEINQSESTSQQNISENTVQSTEPSTQKQTESTTPVIPSAQDPNTKKIVPETDYIDLIRSCSLYEYPYITIGEAFDDFFGATDWYEFYADNGDHIIAVEGMAYENDIYVNFTVFFKLYSNNEFEIYALFVNDQLRSDYDLDSFIQSVFNP